MYICAESGHLETTKKSIIHNKIQQDSDLTTTRKAFIVAVKTTFVEKPASHNGECTT
jgi:hypothetical protein